MRAVKRRSWTTTPTTTPIHEAVLGSLLGSCWGSCWTLVGIFFGSDFSMPFGRRFGAQHGPKSKPKSSPRPSPRRPNFEFETRSPKMIENEFHFDHKIIDFGYDFRLFLNAFHVACLLSLACAEVQKIYKNMIVLDIF